MRRHTERLHRAVLTCIPALCLFAVAGSAQNAAPARLPPQPAPESEFEFARLVYNSGPISSLGRSRWRGSWMVDAPEAETHFLQGVRRLTRVHAGAEGTAIALMDDEIFDHPFLYAVEVGHWYLDDEEAKRLREYLLRGGFLMVDDFHGTIEWERFTESIRRVFPDRPIVEIHDDAEVFHVLFDLDQRVQIPSIWGAITGRTWERDGYTPHWRGIYDDQGRLLVAINFNMDLGDAWEHADNPQYPQPLTALAYRFGINYLIYSMTH